MARQQQVLAGVLLDPNKDGVIDGTSIPYSAISDGVDASAVPPLSAFPFVGTPTAGYDQPASG